MGVKVKKFDYEDGSGTAQYWWHCPACACEHAFMVGPKDGDKPRWTFNGNLEFPSFQPSLMRNRDDPKTRCHSIVTEGKINYCGDCWHPFKGMSVEMVDWEGR